MIEIDRDFKYPIGRSPLANGNRISVVFEQGTSDDEIIERMERIVENYEKDALSSRQPS